MKLLYCLAGMLIFLGQLSAQTIMPAKGMPVSGTVQAALSGKSLPGAVVWLRKANVSALTDMNGTFYFSNILLPDTLVIKLLGFGKKEQVVESSTPVHILLEETTHSLDSVVVSTGYQRIPKERSTGSFGTVNRQLVNRTVSTGILNRLENITPGVLFNKGDAANTDALLIRGRSTIYANAAPLIVLDNFPYDGDINNINPNDVESITILRDAAAASIWGARAGNGVIVITTKKGTATTPKIVLNNNVTVIQRPDLFNRSTIAAGDYIELEQLLFKEGYYANDELFDAWDFGHPPLTPVVELLIAKRDGSMPVAAADAAIEALKQYDVRNDMAAYLYRPGLNLQHSLNISGNTTAVNYYFSAGWDNNRSTIAGSAEKRLSLRTQNTFRITKKLQLDAGINLTRMINTNGNNPGYQLTNGAAKNLYPYARLKDDAGNAAVIVKDHRLAFTEEAVQNGLSDWQYKPLADISLNKLTYSNTDYLVNTAIRYMLLPGLLAELKYQYEYASLSTRDFHDAASYYSRSLINNFTQVDAATGALVYPVPKGAIMDLSEGNLQAHQGRATLGYDRSWQERHQLTVLAGWEVKDLQQNRHAARLYGYNQSRSSVNGNIDYKSLYPLYSNTYLQSTITEGLSVSHTTDRFLSYFGNAAYTWQNLYTLSASIRSDAANLFGVQTNQRRVPLWSGGIAWQVNRETFYHAGWMPSLRLRATYGVNGNISRRASAYTTVSFFSALLAPLDIATVQSPPNAKLRWEKVNMFNAGADFTLGNNLINGSIEYYHKHAKDLLGQAPVDPTLGLSDDAGESFFYGNVASMKGNGVDVNITSHNITGQFQWQTDWLFSYAATKVTDYLMPSGNATYQYLQVSSIFINPVLNRPVYALYSYPWQGLDPGTGDPLGLLGGKSSTDYTAIARQSMDSIRYHGPAQPVCFGAVRNTFSWRNFSLSFNISYKTGYYFRKTSVDYGSLFASWSGHGDYALRWQQPGDEQHTSVPSMVYPANTARDGFYKFSSILVEKADNIRLEDISISVDIAKATYKRLPFNNIRIYCYAANLGVLWLANKKKTDPYYNDMPAQRKRLAAGISIDF